MKKRKLYKTGENDSHKKHSTRCRLQIWPKNYMLAFYKGLKME